MKFDAFSKKIVFCFWTGDTPMSPDRRECLKHLKENIGCEVNLITKKTLPNYILEDHPFHPAYYFLTETQRSDYARAYIMHHYGGGYCDIKLISHSWIPFFEQLSAEPDKWAIGYREINENSVAVLPGGLGEQLRLNWSLLIGNCAYIFKPNTPFTHDWMLNLHGILDDYLPLLKRYPARLAQDSFDTRLYKGDNGRYPINWTGIGGSIVHPLCLKYSNRLLQNLPLPSFKGYR